MGTFFLLLQFTLSRFGLLQVTCQDLGISCVVMSAVPLNKFMVVSRREKQIKYQPFHHVLVHNNKGNNCNLSGRSGSSIYILWSCSSANNWPDPSPVPRTQLAPRCLRNLLPTLPCSFPALQFHMQGTGQYKTTGMFAEQAICSYECPPNGIKAASCQKSLWRLRLNEPRSLPLLLWVPLRQWEVPGKEALKPSIHLFLHLSAVLDGNLILLQIYPRGLHTGNNRPSIPTI